MVFRMLPKRNINFKNKRKETKRENEYEIMAERE